MKLLNPMLDARDEASLMAASLAIVLSPILKLWHPKNSWIFGFFFFFLIQSRKTVKQPKQKQNTMKQPKQNTKSILNIGLQKVEELSWGLGCQKSGFWYDKMRDCFDMHLQAMSLLDAFEIFKNGCQLPVNLFGVHPHCLYSFYNCEDYEAPKSQARCKRGSLPNGYKFGHSAVTYP